jgi:hypothetical protein
MAVEGDLTRVVLPKNFLRPRLLLLLHESPAHGYELRERLRPLGFGRDDPGRLYRALRSLEAAKLVRSAWQWSSGGGAERRNYALARGRGATARAGRGAAGDACRHRHLPGALRREPGTRRAAAPGPPVSRRGPRARVDTS